jgi:TolA-binding protein
LLLAEQGDAVGALAAYQWAIHSGHAERVPVERTPEAAYALGLLLAERGDVAGARAAYQRVIDSGDAEWAPNAAYALRWLK